MEKWSRVEVERESLPARINIRLDEHAVKAPTLSSLEATGGECTRDMTSASHFVTVSWETQICNWAFFSRRHRNGAPVDLRPTWRTSRSLFGANNVRDSRRCLSTMH